MNAFVIVAVLVGVLSMVRTDESLSMLLAPSICIVHKIITQKHSCFFVPGLARTMMTRFMYISELGDARTGFSV